MKLSGCLTLEVLTNCENRRQQTEEGLRRHRKKGTKAVCRHVHTLHM